MRHQFEGTVDVDEMRMRLAKVLKSLIRMRAASDADAMHSCTICQEIGVSPPTLKKLLCGDAGKVEHLFQLIAYLGVRNYEVFQIVDTYTSKEDLNYQVSVLVQRSLAAPAVQVSHVHHQTA